jgi:RNA polymerase sigma factor (TIGR02999 family)
MLFAIEQGDPPAAEVLLPLLYDELRRLAAQKLTHEAPGQTLQATALVHEAYLRLVDGDKAQHWNCRGLSFAAGAEAIRRILIDRARHKQTHKAGGGRRRFDLDDIEPALEEGNGDRLLALDEAVRQLEAEDPARPSWSSSASSPAAPPSRRPPRWASLFPPQRRIGPMPGIGSG